MRRSELTPDLRWNKASGRYINAASGRFVSGKAVRGELDKFLDRTGRDVRVVTEGLRAGSVDLAAWHLQMEKAAKGVHVASAALAKGGWVQLSQADLGRAGQKIRTQYEFLRGFAEDISAGRQRLDGTLARRASMYVEAGRGTYHATERVEMSKRGMVEERNDLHAADSCDGCLSADAMGWVPIGTLPEVGSRTCLTKCQCSIQYRTAEAASA